MLSVADALAQVLQQSHPLPSISLAVSHALGMVLAEAVASDIDSPPFAKALMDGYAVRADDVVAGKAELEIVEEVMAGQVPTQTVLTGQAIRIMTGAPLPQGADAVVMVEHTKHLNGAGLGRVQVETADLIAGKNWMPQGESMRTGEVVLPAGSEVRPVDVGLLAEVGRVEVQVVRRPRVAILPTGDEVVEPSERPKMGQIRNSNGPMMQACVMRCGATPVPLGVGRDQREELRRLMAQGLAEDVLILNGGVSAGVRDLVPEVLAELGVQALFHHVRLKPGKPLLFGICPREGQTPTLVFGLPGNPVSSLVCFELFVRPALRRMLGFPPAGPPFQPARLAATHTHRGDRPTYHPSHLQLTATGWEFTPVDWRGSPDLRGVCRSNALAQFPAGDYTLNAGDVVSVLPL